MVELQAQNSKEIAARYAVHQFIQAGMKIGLGTGSTAAYAVVALADRIRAEGLDVGAIVATSAETERLARFHGMEIEVGLSGKIGVLDITIDGADEIDPHMNLIKGGGGALLREKLVAATTLRQVIVADESKLVSQLGLAHPLPVMVASYGWEVTMSRIETVVGRAVKIRRTPTDEFFVSDDGLYCIDITPGAIENPAALESKIKAITGVVDVGLFIGMASTAVIAGSDGQVRVIDSPSAK